MIKKFLSDSFLYFLASLFTKGLAFFMLPIYVNYLTRKDYGVFDYITTIGAFLGVCVALEITQSVIRFASESREDVVRQAKYISNGLWVTLLSYLAFILVCLFYVDYLSVFITGESGNQFVVILALLSYLSASMMYMMTVIYRARLNAKAATLLSAASGFMVAALSILFIYVFDWGVASLLAGIIVGQTLVVIFSLFDLHRFLLFIIDFKLLSEMLVFSAPLVLSSLGVVLSMLVDRVMIKEMLTFDEVAIYGVAARFAALVSLLIVGVQSALAPLIYSNLKSKALKGDIVKLLKGYFFFAVISVVFLIFVSEPLVGLVAGPEYARSAELIPIIATSVLLHGAYVFFPGLSIEKKTFSLALINIVSGLFNVALNYIFISQHGLLGAAYATLASSALYFILNFLFSEKFFPLIFKVDIE